MKDIHVFMLNYSNLAILKQALLSLKFIDYRIKGVTVLEPFNASLQIGNGFITSKISYEKLIQNDLGLTLNKCIQELHCEYILFLDDQSYFNASVKGEKLQLPNNKFVMTFPNIIQGKVIQRPLLVKVPFLKQNKFFSKYQVPFKEAILSSWLSKISKSFTINISKNFISYGTKSISQNNLQKLIFIEKYQIQPMEKLDTPSISIMISNYNMVEYVETAINSCILQIKPPNEILLIDDGSTDHSYKQIEEYNSLHNFKLFKKENGGKARALNELISHIKTDFVLELDADDWLDPDALMIIGEYLSDIPKDVAVLYGNTRHWRQKELGDIKYSVIKKGRPVNNKQELISYNFPLGPRIYRTSLLKQNNGFPIVEFEDGRMYEDVSLLNKLIKKHQLLYKDFTVYNVREHKSSITKKNKKNHSYWSDFKNKLR